MQMQTSTSASRSDFLGSWRNPVSFDWRGSHGKSKEDELESKDDYEDEESLTDYEQEEKPKTSGQEEDPPSDEDLALIAEARKTIDMIVQERKELHKRIIFYKRAEHEELKKLEMQRLENERRAKESMEMEMEMLMVKNTDAQQELGIETVRERERMMKSKMEWERMRQIDIL